MYKPILELESDGRRSKLIVLGMDISQCISKAQINMDGPEVTLSLELFRLDKATPVEE